MSSIESENETENASEIIEIEESNVPQRERTRAEISGDFDLGQVREAESRHLQDIVVWMKIGTEASTMFDSVLLIICFFLQKWFHHALVELSIILSTTLLATHSILFLFHLHRLRTIASIDNKEINIQKINISEDKNARLFVLRFFAFFLQVILVFVIVGPQYPVLVVFISIGIWAYNCSYFYVMLVNRNWIQSLIKELPALVVADEEPSSNQ
ncbi:hypothetical protein L3Y34_001797 [Caenorhabditis briggsae]|uniref:Uncharacterized protein n=1 Tax=Caenorhabditis briggsae TaxID=6238 RepID=A0AAE9DD44_CAEBR|nr:hypothetical protein L3Y34_001797 [Caenorhabditis briggsae]